MNPETIDLSTWRADAPSSTLRMRVVEAGRPRPKLLPRLGLAGATLAGLALTAFLLTAPVRAEAFVRRARLALQATPRVHIYESFAGILFADVWSQDGQERVRWRFDSVAANQAQTTQFPWNEDRFSGRVPWGLEYSKAGNTVMIISPIPDGQRADYRMEALAHSYFNEGTTLKYKDLGADHDSSVPARRVEVTSVNDPRARQIWTIRELDGLPLRLTNERLSGDWHELTSAKFDYSSEAPTEVFGSEKNVIYSMSMVVPPPPAHPNLKGLRFVFTPKWNPPTSGDRQVQP